MTNNNTPKLLAVQRAGGVLLVALVVATLDLNARGPVHQLILPLCAAAGAWLVTRSVLAVALACCALSAAHIDASGGWIESRAYPVVAVTALVISLGIALHRFKRHIQATHAARWAGRQTTTGTHPGPPDPHTREH